MKLSRRTVLRGAGVTMALPWLESLPAFAATPSSPFPKRFAVLFMGNGINENHWGATGSGDDMKLSLSLSPLEPIKKKVNVINGLFNKHSTGQGIHPAQTGSLLSGAPITRGPVIHAGITVDQMIANHLGQETLQPSIVLACEQPMTGYHETNFSMVYSSHISWQNADSPVPNEVYPALAFDTLFENRGSVRNLSILDRVRESAAELSRQVSSTDQYKLDEFMTSVREVEKRVDGMRKNQDEGGRPREAEEQAGLLDGPAAERPARRSPRAHAPDVRRHRARVSDRQDARRDPAARARPVGAVLPVPRRAERPSRCVARQPVGRLRAHLALPL